MSTHTSRALTRIYIASPLSMDGVVDAAGMTGGVQALIDYLSGARRPNMRTREALCEVLEGDEEHLDACVAKDKAEEKVKRVQRAEVLPLRKEDDVVERQQRRAGV